MTKQSMDDKMFSVRSPDQEVRRVREEMSDMRARDDEVADLSDVATTGTFGGGVVVIDDEGITITPNASSYTAREAYAFDESGVPSDVGSFGIGGSYQTAAPPIKLLYVDGQYTSATVAGTGGV